MVTNVSVIPSTALSSGGTDKCVIKPLINGCG